MKICLPCTDKDHRKATDEKPKGTENVQSVSHQKTRVNWFKIHKRMNRIHRTGQAMKKSHHTQQKSRERREVKFATKRARKWAQNRKIQMQFNPLKTPRYGMFRENLKWRGWKPQGTHSEGSERKFSFTMLFIR